MLEKGTLYVCATPIGNLADITLRVLDTLREADLIAAEDTRHSRKLLGHYDIHTPMISYHEHNENDRAQELVKKLQDGASVALISDAGMPGISDPGYALINLCREQNVPVDVLPGPNAAVTALVLSGMLTESFAFLGFCTGSATERKRKLSECAQLTMTQIFYEAPHKLVSTLKDMTKIYGERPAAVIREISKIHQQVHRGTLPQLVQEFEAERPRGECCIIVAPYVLLPQVGGPEEWRCSVEEEIRAGQIPQVAMKETAKRFGVSKRDVYQAVLEGKN